MAPCEDNKEELKQNSNMIINCVYSRFTLGDNPDKKVCGINTNHVWLTDDFGFGEYSLYLQNAVNHKPINHHPSSTNTQLVWNQDNVTKFPTFHKNKCHFHFFCHFLEKYSKLSGFAKFQAQIKNKHNKNLFTLALILKPRQRGETAMQSTTLGQIKSKTWCDSEDACGDTAVMSQTWEKSMIHTRWRYSQENNEFNYSVVQPHAVIIQSFICNIYVS